MSGAASRRTWVQLSDGWINLAQVARLTESDDYTLQVRLAGTPADEEILLDGEDADRVVAWCLANEWSPERDPEAAAVLAAIRRQWHEREGTDGRPIIMYSLPNQESQQKATEGGKG